MNYPASIHPGLVRAHAAEMAAKPSPRDLMAQAAELAAEAVREFEDQAVALVQSAADIKSFGRSVSDGEQQAIEALARDVTERLKTLAAIRAKSRQGAPQ